MYDKKLVIEEVMPEITEELKADVDDCIKTELENMRLIAGIKSKKKKGKKKKKKGLTPQTPSASPATSRPSRRARETCRRSS